MPPSRIRRLTATVAALALVATLATPALGASPNAGFLTDRPAMLDPVIPGAEVKALISVGDMVDDYRFESLVLGIVSSDQFRKRGVDGLTEEPGEGSTQASLQ